MFVFVFFSSSSIFSLDSLCLMNLWLFVCVSLSSPLSLPLCLSVCLLKVFGREGKQYTLVRDQILELWHQKLNKSKWVTLENCYDALRDKQNKEGDVDKNVVQR